MYAYMYACTNIHVLYYYHIPRTYLLYSPLGEHLCDHSVDVSRCVAIGDLSQRAEVQTVRQVTSMLCNQCLPDHWWVWEGARSVYTIEHSRQ